MIIIEDSNNKISYHNNISDYCRKNNIELVRQRLLVGDYMLGENRFGHIVPIGNISVDTKQDLCELAKDTIEDEKSLNKKYRKCYEQNIHLIVLVETPYNALKDISQWKNPRGTVNGRRLLDKLFRLQVMYGVRFEFCDKKHTGEKIVKLLNGDKNEY